MSSTDAPWSPCSETAADAAARIARAVRAFFVIRVGSTPETVRYPRGNCAFCRGFSEYRLRSPRVPLQRPRIGPRAASSARLVFAGALGGVERSVGLRERLLGGARAIVGEHRDAD